MNYQKLAKDYIDFKHNKSLFRSFIHSADIAIPIIWAVITIWLFVIGNIFASTLFIITVYACGFYYFKRKKELVDTENTVLVTLKNNLIKAISPGDLYDKITILIIKTNRIGTKQIEDELVSNSIAAVILEESYPNILKNKLDNLINELLDTNEKQWDLEDLVRKHGLNKNSDGLINSCYQARINNNRRIELKNEINQLFDRHLEAKKYE